MNTVAILTDFGRQDWYVASMKGCILRISPNANCVDITHEIKPGDVRSAAFVLAQCFREFPEQTIFLCVVDPGVGTDRNAIAIRLGQSYLVGPDNGIFSFLMGRDYEIHLIENQKYIHARPSHTFHGRDIFAPVAGHLANGIKIAEIGPRIEELETLNWPQVNYQEMETRGEIVYIDHYGNAITNIIVADMEEKFQADKMRVLVGKDLFPLAKLFGNVADGNPLAYEGSGGYLEIAVNRGNAKKEFGLEVGQRVEIKIQ